MPRNGEVLTRTKYDLHSLNGGLQHLALIPAVLILDELGQAKIGIRKYMLVVSARIRGILVRLGHVLFNLSVNDLAQQ